MKELFFRIITVGTLFLMTKGALNAQQNDIVKLSLMFNNAVSHGVEILIDSVVYTTYSVVNPTLKPYHYEPEVLIHLTVSNRGEIPAVVIVSRPKNVIPCAILSPFVIINDFYLNTTLGITRTDIVSSLHYADTLKGGDKLKLTLYFSPEAESVKKIKDYLKRNPLIYLPCQETIKEILENTSYRLSVPLVLYPRHSKEFKFIKRRVIVSGS